MFFTKLRERHLVLPPGVCLERGRVVQNGRGAQVALKLLPLGHHAVDFVRFLVLLNAEGVLHPDVIPQVVIAEEDLAALQAFVLTPARPFP